MAVISQPSITGQQRGDEWFRLIVRICAWITVILLGALLVVLIGYALPSIQQFGLSFLTFAQWDPPNEQFGAAAYMYGTVVTSIIALVLALPFAVGSALFVSEY